MEAESRPMKLRSSDNEVFEISREAAVLSKTLNDMVVHLGLDKSDDDVVPLSNVASAVLRRIITWCEHHKQDQFEGELTKESTVGQWDTDFFKVDQATLFEIILAANYMDIKPLLDMGCKMVANLIKGKSPEEIRRTFNVKNDFTPEEEEQIRKENAWCED